MHPYILIYIVHSAVGVVSNVCPDLLVEYQGKCFAECPEETNLIVGNNNCTIACPEFAPIKFDHTCVDHCPIGHSISPNSRTSCVKTKHPDKNPGSTAIFYSGCPASFHCDSVRPFCYKLQCFEHCPPGTKILNSQCVDICPKNRPYIFNQTCKTSCPLSHRFMTEKVCSSSCAEGLKTYGSTCVVDCPQGTFSLKSECVATCPHTSPFILTIKNVSSCHEQCPASTAVNALKCELSCPPDKPYLFNRTCVTLCPVDHPYLMSKQSEYSSLALCLRFCPEDRVIDDVTCVRKCINGMVLFNKTCVRNCPSSKPFVNMDFECVIQCSNKEYVYQSKCFQDCPGDLKIFGPTCVDDCRNTTKPFITYTDSKPHCVSKCPDYYFNDSFKCVWRCPASRNYMVNNTCYEACAVSLPYYRPSRYLFSLDLYNKCLKNCNQREYIYQNKCVDRCPTNLKYVLNKTCHDKCPASHPYMKSVTGGIKCLTKCDFRLDNSSYCLDKCPKDTFYYNNTCGYVCPNELPFNTMNKTCVSRCELYFNKSCIRNCPSGLCKYNQSCIPANGTNLIYSVKEKDGRHVKVCVNSCPPKTVRFGISCVVSCPKTYVYFKGLCAKKCPPSHPYKDVTSQKSSNVCVKTCPKGTVYYADQCRKSCPSERPLNSKNTCVTRCPNHLPYNENYVCKSKCDNHNYINKNECVSYCPLDKDLVANSVCYSECPPEYPHEVYQQCLSACKEDYVLDKNTSECIDIYECSSRKKKVLDNQFCVENCPDNSVFNTLTKACYSFTNTELSLSVAAVFCLPVIAIIGCIFCHGNFKIKGRICFKKRYQPIAIDEDETCVMEICSANDSNTDTSKDETCVMEICSANDSNTDTSKDGDGDTENSELKIDEPVVYITEDISMKEV